MCRQLAEQASTQAPKGMGIILLNGELPRQLPIHGFDQLTDGVMKMLERIRNLLLLVRPWDGSQANSVLFPQFGGFGRTDVAFVTQHFQIRVFVQQLKARFQISAIGRSQFKIEYQPAHGDQQVQSIAKEGLFFGHRLSISRIMSLPVTHRTRHQMKQHHRDGQTVQNALTILAQIQTAQDDHPDQVDRSHQIPATTIETTLGRNVRKQVPNAFPATQQFSFHVPAPAFTNQTHRDQLTVGAFGFGSRTFEEWRNRFPNVIHHDKHPGAKIIKFRYHQTVLRLVRLCCGDPILTISEDFSQSDASSIRP